nr:30S ribosomal protein S7 [Candidatus Gracilibacteria bacterium]
MNKTENLLEKFTNYVMLEGKKSLALELMDKTFEDIKSRGQKDPKAIFFKALENVMPKIEVRPKRVGGSIYQVPQEVNPKRQLFLASRWIIKAARGKKGGSFTKFLATELIDAANETGDSVKKKLEVYKMAEANKAFARFANR